jgi:hypothetical protein
MSTLSELIEKGKQHQVTISNDKGKPIFDLSVLWAVIISVAAPQAFFLVVLLALLGVIQVAVDGRPLTLGTMTEDDDFPSKSKINPDTSS